MGPRLEAPIIIVGNGGSGSSLLDRILNAHPDIDMKGEMKFLVADAWAAFSRSDADAELWNRGTIENLAKYFDADPTLEQRIKKSAAEYQALLTLLERDKIRRNDEELVRRGAIIRRSVSEWFLLEKSSARYWGFKEITNSGEHDWSCYDHIFPQAIWIHITRHPVNRLHAASRLSGQQLTDQTIRNLLRVWLATIDVSKQRRATGRYFEIRYEDLWMAPERTLSPLFDRLGVKWHDECRYAIDRQWGARSERLPLPANIDRLVAEIDRLEQAMHACGYRLDDGTADDETKRRLPAVIEPSDAGRWKLTGPYFHDSGKGWKVDLSHTAIAGELAGIADRVWEWERSPLRLFENDRALGPAHALHYQIRRDGCGRFSHWQDHLFFATSDNSNPNENGRIYSFDLLGERQE